MQVATVDVGGWDTHTDEASDLDNNLASFAQALAAFMTDLGPDRRKRVTVVVQTEFGRRVATNGTRRLRPRTRQRDDGCSAAG